MSLKAFSTAHMHSHKEVLLIQSNPSTIDRKNLHDELDIFVKASIIVNIVSLNAITHVFSVFYSNFFNLNTFFPGCSRKNWWILQNNHE